MILRTVLRPTILLFGATLPGTLVMFAQVTPAMPATQSGLSTSTAASAYGRLPLTFEANRGQTDPTVNFLSRGNGYSVFLTAQGMVLSLKPSSQTTDSTVANVATQSAPAKTISLSLVGAAAHPSATGEKQQPGIANYFVGSDHTKWHTHIPTYAQVRYKDIYPGIDLVYYGSNRQVEYDFDIAANADPSQIKLLVKGADQLSISDDGDLELKAGTAQLVLKAPAIYQKVNGQRSPVLGKYRVDGQQIVFDVAAHDASKPLVIDPVLVYSSYLGGRSK